MHIIYHTFKRVFILHWLINLNRIDVYCSYYIDILYILWFIQMYFGYWLQIMARIRRGDIDTLGKHHDENHEKGSCFDSSSWILVIIIVDLTWNFEASHPKAPPLSSGVSFNDWKTHNSGSLSCADHLDNQLSLIQVLNSGPKYGDRRMVSVMRIYTYI